ncbi:sensor histidine kinase [Microterricola viridarii]|uniref:Histidine kinase/HSP90-like ATPase domain-containing protein n=1 Tax=Microterricola viridarii TaxID=412690 RepID=A0A0X8E462_9MICO|nr:hypothetical protein [Microterricola viridarii]AMB59399.1 hypothetical protein AWU67_11610 [Microterricola viridarii]
MTAGAIGLAGLVFGVLAVGPFRDQHAGTLGPYAILSFVVLVGLPIVIGLWGSWAPLPVLIALCTLEAVAMLAVLTGWPLLHGYAHDEALGMPWPLGISALPIVCVALVMRGPLVWAYLGVIGLLTVWVMYTSNSGPEALLEAIQTGLYATSFASVFVGLVLVGLQSAERLDLLQAAERLGAARNAARLAREAERARFDGLIHDGVISTLLMVGRAEQVDGDHVRQAADTLAQLERIAAGVRAAGVVPVAQLIVGLRRLAEQNATPFAVELDEGVDSAVLTLPAGAVEAMVAAGGEALRNSLEHAGGRQQPRTVARRIELWVQEDVIAVGIRDDGVGFEPARVRPERMGLARSIRARMDELAGGYAVVDSQPGQGTLVTLGWVRR